MWKNETPSLALGIPGRISMTCRPGRERGRQRPGEPAEQLVPAAGGGGLVQLQCLEEHLRLGAPGLLLADEFFATAPHGVYAPGTLQQYVLWQTPGWAGHLPGRGK